MNEDVYTEYAKKIKALSSDKETIFCLLAGTYGEEHIKYMMKFIDENPNITISNLILENLTYSKEYKREKSIAAVMGFVVGDALGVPVEFVSRAELKENPVEKMLSYGTHHQPAGTWSDDTSMTLATMEWLIEGNTYKPDYAKLMDKFSGWLMYGDYTPYSNNFDCGISTGKAIMNYGKGLAPTECGGKAEDENGNGSLMRILPIALWLSSDLCKENVDAVAYICEMSSLTHAHVRSKMACVIYSVIISKLLHYPECDKIESVRTSVNDVKRYFLNKGNTEILQEMPIFQRIWDIEKLMKLSEEEIRSSGYVVDTLEAALWTFLNTKSYSECVLEAVNLGDDTDTVGAVVGGLAGMYYGMENIPHEWVTVIPKKDWIIDLASHLLDAR